MSSDMMARVAPPPERRREAQRLLVIPPLLAFFMLAMLLLRYYWPAAWPFDLSGSAVGRDFANLWTCARSVAAGDVQALYEPARYSQLQQSLFGSGFPEHNWSYPPVAVFLCLPFAGLGYGAALALWTVSGLLACLAVAFAGRPGAGRSVALPLLLLAPALIANGLNGQNGFLTGFLFAAGLLLVQRLPLLAGALLGLLVFKPHLLIALPVVLAAMRAWRALATLMLSALLLTGLSALIFGMDSWRLFASVTMPMMGRVAEMFDGFFTLMMVSGYAALRSAGLPFGLAMAGQGLLSLAALALTYRGIRATRDIDGRLAIAALGSLLALPYAFNYDMVMLAIALARLGPKLTLDGPDDRVPGLAIGMSACLPLLAYFLAGPLALLKPLILLAALVSVLRLKLPAPAEVPRR